MPIFNEVIKFLSKGNFKQTPNTPKDPEGGRLQSHGKNWVPAEVWRPASFHLTFRVATASKAAKTQLMQAMLCRSYAAADPHETQNFAPGASSAPHCAQLRPRASATGVPHETQNLAPAASAAPQLPHALDGTVSGSGGEAATAEPSVNEGQKVVRRVPLRPDVSASLCG